jgi:hypothetical protein
MKTTNETTVQHTPGPWSVYHSVYGPVIDTADGIPVAKLHHANVGPDQFSDENDTWPNEANARLIAAAPDMLAALEANDAVFTDLIAYATQSLGARFIAQIRAAAKANDAAIAKAKGITA